jgi:hypothetical protein
MQEIESDDEEEKGLKKVPEELEMSEIGKNKAIKVNKDS